jgi:hypothetical protein
MISLHPHWWCGGMRVIAVVASGLDCLRRKADWEHSTPFPTLRRNGPAFVLDFLVNNILTVYRQPNIDDLSGTH